MIKLFFLQKTERLLFHLRLHQCSGTLEGYKLFVPNKGIHYLIAMLDDDLLKVFDFLVGHRKLLLKDSANVRFLQNHCYIGGLFISQLVDDPIDDNFLSQIKFLRNRELLWVLLSLGRERP